MPISVSYTHLTLPLGTSDDVFASSSFKYSDIDSKMIDGVVKEMNVFTDLFYKLDEEFSFYKKFGAMNTEDLEDLRPLFTRDIAKSVRDGMSDKNLKDKVEETLFFYPIREILCAIGGNNKMLEPEDE